MSNPFFPNLSSPNEQKLIEDLVVESISIYAHDVKYCTRTLVNKDDIYGEDSVSIYESALPLETYVRTYDSYEGDGTFMSKFNIEIRDQLKLSIALRTFDEQVGQVTGIIRPREGDLVYSSMMKRLFTIMYVNPYPVFYQFGRLQFYEATCEVFEYSNERLRTGDPEIDAIEEDYSFDLSSFAIQTSDGDSLVDQTGQSMVLGQFVFDEQLGDVFADNDEFISEDREDGVIDWSTMDPLSRN